MIFNRNDDGSPFTYGFAGFSESPDLGEREKPCTDPGEHLWEEQAMLLLSNPPQRVSICVHCGARTARTEAVAPPRLWRDK